LTTRIKTAGSVEAVASGKRQRRLARIDLYGANELSGDVRIERRWGVRRSCDDMIAPRIRDPDPMAGSMPMRERRGGSGR
jgi:hypothetical protein